LPSTVKRHLYCAISPANSDQAGHQPNRDRYGLPLPV